MASRDPTVSSDAMSAQGQPQRQPQPTLTLLLPNLKESCGHAQQQVNIYLRQFLLSAKAQYRIELVIEEVMMNQIWHAFADKENHLLGLQVRVHERQLALTFDDDGRAFNPLEAAAPVAPTALDDAVLGGWGIALVKKYAVSLGYERAFGKPFDGLR